MSKKKNVKKPVQKTRKEISWFLIPVMLILGVLPLITRLTEHTSEVKEILFHAGTEKNYDIFLYAKGIFLMAVAGVMMGILIWRWFTDTAWPKLNKFFIPLGIYALWVILSSAFSEYTQISMGGIEDGYESMFVLLSYCILPVYTYVFIRSENDVKKIIRWWPVGVCLLIVLGITQIFGFDFWSTAIGRKFLLPISEWDAKLSFNFEAGRVYLSQYNPNYVGPLASMIIIMFGVLTIFAKKWLPRILYAGITVGMFICLLASQSKNGMLAVFLGGILLCIFLHKWLKKYWYVFLGVFVLFATGLGILNYARGGVLSGAIQATWRSITKGSSATDRCPELEAIRAGEKYVEITYGGETIYIKGNIYEEDNSMTFDLKDEDGKVLTYHYDEEKKVGIIDDERFEDILLATTVIEDIPCISVNIGAYKWRFSDRVGKDGYYYASPNGVFTKMQPAETAIFTNMPSFASGRGYIWARSIPMLKDTMLIGRGADNFRLYFPQYDYVAATKSGFAAKNVGTPHNMYLQIGVNTGVISLIAFLAFFVMYFVDCIRLYRKDDFKEFLPQAGIGICVACFAYMMTGIMNDSMVCVAPVFWCLMGVGLAINRMYRKEKRI